MKNKRSKASSGWGMAKGRKAENQKIRYVTMTGMNRTRKSEVFSSVSHPYPGTANQRVVCKIRLQADGVPTLGLNLFTLATVSSLVQFGRRGRFFVVSTDQDKEDPRLPSCAMNSLVVTTSSSCTAASFGFDGIWTFQENAWYSVYQCRLGSSLRS